MTHDQQELVEHLADLIAQANTHQEDFISRTIEAHNNSEAHQFVATLMLKETRQREIWDKVKGNMIFWLLVGATGTAGIAIWDYLTDRIIHG